MKKIVLCLLLLSFYDIAFSRIIPVGKNESITTLRAGVEAAQNGDTVLLKEGIYKEAGTITITKPITLLGEKGAVLEGEDKYELLVVSGKNVRIKGITFQNSGYSSLNDFASVKVIDAYGVIIESNTILNSYFAIHVSNTSFCIIRNNYIKGSPKTEQTTGDGIHLWKCNAAYIRNNYIEGHRDGIYFEFVTFSHIENNESIRNIRYGLHFMFSNNDTYLKNTFKANGAGVAVMYSNNVDMFHNNFDSNWGPNAYGILLKDIGDSKIIHNRFQHNTVGILMEGSSRFEVANNSFTNNGWALRVQANCDDNRFVTNNFEGNTFDVATNGTMTLNVFENNYWDKYEGYDLNKDKIGDVPYHPVSMYAMIIEQNPSTLMLLRSFMVTLLDKLEKAIPTLTPANLYDNKPSMKRHAL